MIRSAWDGRLRLYRRALRALPIVAIVFVSVIPPNESSAQVRPGVDTEIFFAVYNLDSNGFGTAMTSANRISWPLFIATPFSYWSVGLIDNSRSTLSNAYMISVAEAATIGSVVVLKRIFSRNRPYDNLAGVRDRSRSAGARSSASHYSFPSGHAAISFSLASSLSLASGRWYVIGPAYLVASTIGLSRVWLGVHFPSDVLAGAALGTLVAITLDHFRDSLTPKALKEDEFDAGRSILPPVTIRISL